MPPPLSLVRRLGRLLWGDPDPPALRSPFRLICRRSMQFSVLICVLDAAIVARIDRGPWEACLALALVAWIGAWTLRPERAASQVLAALVGFGLALIALGGLLSWRYGSAAGFHWPLFTLLMVIAVVPRLQGPLRVLLMLLVAGALLWMGSQAGQLNLAPALRHRLAVLNFGVMAVSSLSLVMHYRALVQRLHEQLNLLAETDTLTGLLNRRALSQAVGRLRDAQARQPTEMAVLLIDLDHFKRINDVWGHQAGDRALQHVALLLGSLLRRGDLAARWGGEEFLLLLTHSNARGAQRLAERLLQALADSPLELANGERWSLGATVGVAALQASEDLEQALRRADLALYEGKREGRNRVVMASA